MSLNWTRRSSATACMQSVMQQGVQFNHAKNVSLTESLDIYLQQLPQHQQTPERPTCLKDVSLAKLVPLLS